MRIAIVGTRGVPANYGGFETFAEELGSRLASRGHDVRVYCRRGNQKEALTEYRGMTLTVLPSIHTKHLDTLSHTYFSVLHLAFHRTDVAFFCNSANACFMPLPNALGIKTVMNPDGLEWERAKWGWAAKQFYRMSEHLVAWFAHAVVSDSQVIQRYYKEKFARDSEFVAYGADLVERGTNPELVEALGVEPGKYFLYVSRLEPENNAHLVVEAFEKVKTGLKLLMVGSAPFAGEYIERLRATRDPRIVFPGGQYGQVYKALQANAYVYVNAMEVGGTHPAILEAMGAGNCVLVSDIAYNEEAVAQAGLTFRNKDRDDLADKMQWLAGNSAEVEKYRQAAVERVREQYTWESVVDAYEKVFAGLCSAAGGST